MVGAVGNTSAGSAEALATVGISAVRGGASSIAPGRCPVIIGCAAVSLNGCCLPKGQPHDGPAIGARRGRDLAALCPGKLTHDVQAEADPAEPPPVARLALHEALEDSLDVGRRDADALVPDRDLDLP